MTQSLLQYISDGDLSTKLESVEYSTNLRSIVTVEYMMERYGTTDTVEVYEPIQEKTPNQLRKEIIDDNDATYKRGELNGQKNDKIHC